jgi:hypothetical protein
MVGCASHVPHFPHRDGLETIGLGIAIELGLPEIKSPLL